MIIKKPHQMNQKIIFGRNYVFKDIPISIDLFQFGILLVDKNIKTTLCSKDALMCLKFLIM